MSTKVTTTAMPTRLTTTTVFWESVASLESLVGYRPEQIGDNQVLRGDWRLLVACWTKHLQAEQIEDDQTLAAHWAKHAQGGLTPWPKDQILVAAIKLVTILCRRSAVIFHPSSMEPGACDLYDRVEAELGALQVQVPHVLTAEELRAADEDLNAAEIPLGGEQLKHLHTNLHLTWESKDLDHEFVWNVHASTVEELKQRGLEHPVTMAKSSLDRSLPAVTEVGMQTPGRALAPERFVPFVVTHDVLSLAGSVCYDVSPNDYDWVVRGGGNLPLPLIERALDDFLPDVDNHVFDDPLGPNWDYVPLGDLVAWPSDAELPEIEVTQAPKGLEFLEGLPAFHVRRRWLGLAPEGEILLVVGSAGGGVILKLERIWHDCPVVVASVPVLPSSATPIADLVFVPYSETSLVQLAEPKFREQALEFWQTSEGKPPSPESKWVTNILGVTDLLFEADDLIEAKHSRNRCMKKGCDAPPVIDVHWADGRGRAWFCLPHFEKWATEGGGREIVRAWFIKNGEVPRKMGQGDSEQILKLNARLSVDELVSRLKTLVQSLAEARAQAKPSVTPLESFTPCKASKGYHEASFTRTDDLWKLWAAGYAKQGILVQQKYDGVRLVEHLVDGKVAIFTEDKHRDRVDIFPEIVAELRDLPCDSCVLDCEFVWYEGGRPKPRWEMAAFVSGKEPLTGDIRVNVHDLVYLDGDDVHARPYSERLSLLRKLIPRSLKFHRVAPTRLVHTRKEFDEAVEWASRQPGSEGAVLKTTDFIYELEGDPPRSPLVAKFKIVTELKVQIVGVSPIPIPFEAAGLKMPRKPLSGKAALEAHVKVCQAACTWRYRAAVLSDDKLKPIESDATVTPADVALRWVIPGKEDPVTGKMVSGERPEWRGLGDPAIWKMGLGFESRKVGETRYGTTYATGIEARIGDIVTVTPVAVRYLPARPAKDQQPRLVDRLTWMFPIVKHADPDRTKPDTLADAKRLADLTETRGHPALKDLKETWRSPPIGSAGGKYYLAPTIAALLPPHKVYVEPFSGSAAVLFAKPRAETEVINDTDAQLARTMKDIQEISLGDMHILRGMDWRPSKQKFDGFRDGKPPADRLARLHRYLYLNWFGFGSKTTTYRGHPAHWNLDSRLERVDQARHRLQRVKVYSQDALKVIKKWDSAETVVYLDPPYPGSDTGSAWPDYTVEDFEALVGVLKKLKGKFILSISDTPEYRKLLAGFCIRALKRPHLLPQGSAFDGGGKLTRSRKELLVANFLLPKMLARGLDWPSMRAVAGRGSGGRLNSPTFAFLAVNGRMPPRPLRGRTEHPTRLWRGVHVDVHLRDEWLDPLADIEGIEVRSSCEGHRDGDLVRPTFLVFRLMSDRDSEAKSVAGRIHRPPRVYSLADEGSEGRPRIVVASPAIYGEKGFEAFWQNLPGQIKEALGKPSVPADGLVERGDQLEKDEERLPPSAGKPRTREEERAATEKLLGDSYMVEQPPDRTFPSTIQYHLRGIYAPDQLAQIRKDLKATSNQEDLDQVWKKWKGLVWLKVPFEQIRKVAQKADDERGDVTKAIHQHIETDPLPFGRLAGLYPRIGNVGSAHVDWRQVDPSMRYLSCSWTCDVRKSVFQTVEDEVLWFLRDRVMENQPGDQWLCQKKCPGSIDEDESLLLPWLLRQETVVEDACHLLADWQPGLFLSIIEGPRPAEALWASVQPLVWLTIVDSKRLVLDVPPGEVGASTATAGRFIWVADLETCYGCRKSDFYESFHFWKAHNRALFPKLDYAKLDGRWDVKFIEAGKVYEKAGEEFWMGNRPWTEKGQLPYILTHSLGVEIKKAKRDKIQLIWNEAVIPVLKRMKYPHLLPGI